MHLFKWGNISFATRMSQQKYNQKFNVIHIIKHNIIHNTYHRAVLHFHRLYFLINMSKINIHFL